MAIAFTLNGKSTTVDAPPEMPLPWVLRDELDLEGTKFGCGRSFCGACTVRRGTGSAVAGGRSGVGHMDRSRLADEVPPRSTGFPSPLPLLWCSSGPMGCAAGVVV